MIDQPDGRLLVSVDHDRRLQDHVDIAHQRPCDLVHDRGRSLLPVLLPAFNVKQVLSIESALVVSINCAVTS
jgi:hypothetical protein